MKTSLITLVAALGLLAGLSGCNTVRGVGEDVQKAGSAIEKAATK
ncbi:entericidin A/B family lipoprotein [Tibeticola sp.]|nr:entericidin A/B family lipoprotein [Tibeticola sp.]QLQ00542.1 MAG: entericidin A/B family lipoprotein [Burkholderiaceae bacterium]